MRSKQRAIDSYGEVQVVTGVASANSVELIQMLFDGLIESLSITRGHIQRGAVADKAKSIARASRLVLGLQGALDFEKGGDLANNLNELYGYVTRRLIHVNIHNDLKVLDEIHGLMSEIREAWEHVPSLVPAPAHARHQMN